MHSGDMDRKDKKMNQSSGVIWQLLLEKEDESQGNFLTSSFSPTFFFSFLSSSTSLSLFFFFFSSRFCPYLSHSSRWWAPWLPTRFVHDDIVLFLGVLFCIMFFRILSSFYYFLFFLFLFFLFSSKAHAPPS